MNDSFEFSCWLFQAGAETLRRENIIRSRRTLLSLSSSRHEVLHLYEARLNVQDLCKARESQLEQQISHLQNELAQLKTKRGSIEASTRRAARETELSRRKVRAAALYHVLLSGWLPFSENHEHI